MGLTTDFESTKPIKKFAEPDLESKTKSFEVDASNTVKAGQDVFLHTNGKIRAVSTSTGAQFPIGYALKDGAAGDLVPVVTNFRAIFKANNATGGSVNAGVFLKPDATQTGGYDDYVAVANGDYVQAITLEGGASLATIQFGLLYSPFQKGA